MEQSELLDEVQKELDAAATALRSAYDHITGALQAARQVVARREHPKELVTVALTQALDGASGTHAIVTRADLFLSRLEADLLGKWGAA